MVHHIVMWKFKPEVAEEKKPEIKAAMKENLSALWCGIKKVDSLFSRIS